MPQESCSLVKKIIFKNLVLLEAHSIVVMCPDSGTKLDLNPAFGNLNVGQVTLPLFALVVQL